MGGVTASAAGPPWGGKEWRPVRNAAGTIQVDLRLKCLPNPLLCAEGKSSHCLGLGKHSAPLSLRSFHFSSLLNISPAVVILLLDLSSLLKVLQMPPPLFSPLTPAPYHTSTPRPSPHYCLCPWAMHICVKFFG
uniref:Uncharacterized protein n=1 Tax=Myotis myotis TaxID=51298 RepID=A0A7J7WHY7_MYOMY|nr:hypothetical protein mMyoMyo1_012039 [Myotis myotis]